MEKNTVIYRIDRWAGWVHRATDGGTGWPSKSLSQRIIEAGVAGAAIRGTAGAWEQYVPQGIRNVDEAISGLGEIGRMIVLARWRLLRDKRGDLVRFRRDRYGWPEMREIAPAVGCSLSTVYDWYGDALRDVGDYLDFLEGGMRAGGTG